MSESDIALNDFMQRMQLRLEQQEQRYQQLEQASSSTIAQLSQQIQQMSASMSHGSSGAALLKPPKPAAFDGHVPAPSNWVYEMQNYLVSAGVDLDSPIAVTHAVPYLKDAAQTWYRQHQQAVEATTATPYSSWAAFKAALLHQFAPVDPQAHAHDELMALSMQEHPDISSYTERFIAVVVDLPHMHASDRIWFYTQGLPTEVRMHVRMHKPDSLSHAMELAAQAGEASHGGSGLIPPLSGPTPSSSAPAPMELGSMRASHGNRAGAPSGPPMVCFFCEQPGHSFRHCKLLAQLKRELAAKRAAGVAV